MNLQDDPHRRLNPLTGEWVLVSPHRTKRPWQGKVERLPAAQAPEHDPACYLCPGNQRAGGVTNPRYESTFVFVNDFSALLPQGPGGELDREGLLVAKSERGLCKVLCFSPRHDLTLARMEVESILPVVEMWTEQYREIGALDFISYVQIFENRGEVMGASNPHPHGQVWANENLPVDAALETARQGEYLASRGRCLLCSYLETERAAGERIVFENTGFVALVPFWAVWPFEVMILPKKHHVSLLSLSPQEKRDLADAVHRLGVRYDNLFETSFPYSMGFHQSPTDGKPHEAWHLHLHYYPPLLRSATVRKFMVGYELLGMPQRDITAEGAAARLRSLPELHYLGGAAS